MGNSYVKLITGWGLTPPTQTVFLMVKLHTTTYSGVLLYITSVINIVMVCHTIYSGVVMGKTAKKKGAWGVFGVAILAVTQTHKAKINMLTRELTEYGG